jgi:hypothetical protein
MAFFIGRVKSIKIFSLKKAPNIFMILNLKIKRISYEQRFPNGTYNTTVVMCNKCHAIIDNSHSYIRGPKDIIDQFYLDIGTSDALYPCNQRKSLPSNIF